MVKSWTLRTAVLKFNRPPDFELLIQWIWKSSLDFQLFHGSVLIDFYSFNKKCVSGIKMIIITLMHSRIFFNWTELLIWFQSHFFYRFQGSRTHVEHDSIKKLNDFLCPKNPAKLWSISMKMRCGQTLRGCQSSDGWK